MAHTSSPRTPSLPSTTASDQPGGGSPFRQILLKIHSRCNLSCDHCYVYRHVDQTWRRQPVAMSQQTIDLAAMRVAEHAARHDLPSVTVILHGGEPLLAGPELIDHAAAAVRTAVAIHTRVDLRVQTNGLLLDDRFLALFAARDIRVGVSLDGGPVANDRHRRFANGRGSYHEVARAIRLLGQDRYRHLYSGILCTADLRNDPLEVYESLLALEPPRLDFLLPHGNWDSPPPGVTGAGLDTPYADWLCAIFDRWYGAPHQETRIRLFESVISLLLGGPSFSEAVGLSPIDLLTIETDGSIEQADVLKTSAEGMAATGLHIARDSFDQALAHPMVRARQLGLAALSTTCRACPVVRVCGGGLYAHRYRAQNGFDNPSVFCHDLRALIAHVRRRLAADITKPGKASGCDR
jgi:uncharacterized protein